MSGKSYSIRELKTIVDYLVAHNAYGEVRGRKMWMDFASTRLTNRTWQSLKEAFLKRILPDITNPYYRLDVTQIHSFKRGQNLTEKNKKHLDFVPVEDKSNKSDANGDNEQPSISNNNEKNGTGEDTTCSKLVHNRASTETLILGCYETAEDIQRDLEKSTDEEQDDEQDGDKSKSQSKPPKSLRDFIVYTEPLTPMLQEVLHDFATDDESDRMLIDENYVASERKSNSPEPAELSQSILKSKVAAENTKTSRKKGDNEDNTNHDSNKEVAENNEQAVKTTEKQLTDNHEESAKNNEASLSQFEDVMNLVDRALSRHLGCELNTQKDESQGKARNSHDSSLKMTDSLLPNNQEAVNSQTFPNATPILPAPEVNGDQSSKKRKRSSSAEKKEKKKTKKQADVKLTENNKNQSDALEMIGNAKETDLNNATNQNNINDAKAVDSETEKNKAELLKKKYNLRLNNSKASKELNKTVSVEAVIHHINSDSSEIIVNPAQVENPCLKSVSLYAEQFSSTKYSDSDLCVMEDDGKKKATNKDLETKSSNEGPVAETADDVILLKSRSSSESENDSPTHVSPRLTLKQKRDKLAKVFGFANGGGAQSRRMNGRKRTTSHRSYQYVSSESSEWTSASDTEYSPPRGRRYRYPRTHFKPHSGRVLSLEDCGGMYVMLGKKVYPFVKQGKTIATYVTKSSESDPDEEDNYWKNKYVEEKKRTSGLKKILQKSKHNGLQVAAKPESPIEVPPPPVQHQRRQSLATENVNDSQLATRKVTEIPDKQNDEKTLKIKFTKKDQEIQLEGYWQHINPVLAQVVSMFHKEPAKQPDPANCVELSSGTTTPRPLPADTGVKEKINKIESDIFKEIVEKHEEDVQPASAEEIKESSITSVEKEDNVTVRKRRGRPKTSVSPSVTSSPSKSAERSPLHVTKLNNVHEKEQAISDDTPRVATERRSTRTPKKLLEVATSASTKQVKSRKSSAKAPDNEDEELLYKFPSPSPPPTKRSKKSTDKVKKAIETAANHLKTVKSPDGLSNNSVNSNQGYQDSDASPFNIGHRKKRRFSVSTMSLKRRKSNRSRSKSLPHIVDYETSDSNNSSFSISVKSVTQSTNNSEVHRSESYQLLMPRTKKIVQALEKIEEATNERILGNITQRTLSNVSVEIEISDDHVRTNYNEATSSSNLSFPPSPELSIVENISVSKSTITANEDYPTINEMQSQLTAMNPNVNKFLMSEVDVSMPLMAQECSLQKHLMNVFNEFSDLKQAGRFLSALDLSAPKMSTTDSIMNEMKSASIEGSLSDSLDRRLEQLLLESAQKSTASRNQVTMEVDTEAKKNPRSRKRSSTPNKKKTLQRITKIPEVSIVEEENKARCSRNGRRSCPPAISILYREGDVPDNLEINIHEHTTPESRVTPATKRKSVKKNVIKVKILRPKKKPTGKKKSPKTRTELVECDNESGVFVQEPSDLIHNHSELCLFNEDCTERKRDSVEFIETTAQSIISLNSSGSPEGSKENIDVNIVIEDAQCSADLVEAKVTEAESPGSATTQYFTPVSPNCSIITEDLSDEMPIEQPSKPRPTKWYLLSEEDTTSTINNNYFDSYQYETNHVRSYGANLQQLFPVTCSVPDLSTITEMSEKNSPKPGLENLGDTFDSQSIN